jgi:type IV secretion system protein VirB2
MNVKSKLKLLIVMALSLLPVQAWASAAGGGLPWEAPLQTVARSLQGPVALAISIIAMMTVGGILVFDGQLTEFGRKACLLVLAISLLVAGNSFMSILFGVSGALI